MVRFIYDGQTEDRDITPVQPVITATAREIAEWPPGVASLTRETGATSWRITCQGETVTAEVV